MSALTSFGSLNVRFTCTKVLSAVGLSSRHPSPSRPILLASHVATQQQAQGAASSSVLFREALDPARVTARWSGPSAYSAGVAVVSTVGKHRGVGKLFNQDAFAVEQVQPLPSTSATATLITVCDGHGTDGHLIAKHVAQQVAAAAQEAAEAALAPPSPESSLWWDAEFYHVSNMSTSDLLAAEAAAAPPPAAGELSPSLARQVLEQAFGRAAESVGYLHGADTERSGATAVACMVLPNSVVAAWAGDSRAVLGTAGAEGAPNTATQLTRDHKPNAVSEMSRVLATGGKVVRAADSKGRPLGPFRIVPDPSSGWKTTGVAVARAFGDLAFAKVGVVPTPEVAVFQRVASSASPPAAGAGPEVPSQVLIVATDGLWDMLSNEEAVEVAFVAGCPEMAAQQLAEAARQRWVVRSGGRTCDDITVAVVYL